MSSTTEVTKDAKLQVQQASSSAVDERVAVSELRRQITGDDHSLLLFFCSSDYNLDRLSRELRGAFREPIVGCTTAGQLNDSGFSKGGITAVAITGGITATPYKVDLDNWENDLLSITSDIARAKRSNEQCRSFGLLLVDGLSRMEERLVAELYRYLPQVPLVGGSAGDDLKFKGTHVFTRGEFHTRTAVFVLFRTRLPFTTFKFEHFTSDGQTLVITESDPDRRIIREINGEPAESVYAAALGMSVEQLNPKAFSCHPFVLEIGGDLFLRSIQQVNPDGSLTLYCAIENGVVLCLGRAVDPVGAAAAAFQRVQVNIGKPSLIIGCDCILRKLEFEANGMLETMGRLLAGNNVVGFSTYGEQYNGIHVNQTFTGVAIGS